MEKVKENTTEIKKKRILRRSPNFPAINLKEAINRVKLIYEAEGQNRTKEAAVFKHLGYTGRNGASAGILSAIRKFDLIREENGRIFVTDNARFILTLSESDKKRENLIKTSALKPEIYNTLWDSIKTYTKFPSEESLRSDLITDYGFNEKSISKFISDFKETLKFAGLEVGKSDTKEQENGEIEGESILLFSEEQTKKLNALRKPLKHKPSMENAVVKEYEIPRKGGKLAVIQIEKPFSKADYENITKWLELFKDTLIEEEEELNEPI